MKMQQKLLAAEPASLAQTLSQLPPKAALAQVMVTAQQLRQQSRQLDNLKFANQQLTKAYQAQSDYFSILFHDIRLVATVVCGLSKHLGTQPPAKGEQLLQMIQANGKHLEKLLNAAHQVEITALHEDQSFPLFDFNHAVVESILDYEPLFRNKNIRLMCSIPVDSVMVSGQQQYFVRALGNLLSNAAKFAPFESMVEIIAAVGDDYVEIKVIDQGPGMTPEEQALLFTEHCRILPMDKSQGSGMGLYLTKRLIDRMGGQVWCNSVAEKGTCFGIRLGKTFIH